MPRHLRGGGICGKIQGRKKRKGICRLRIRKKKWARPELAACPFYLDAPQEAAGGWASAVLRGPVRLLHLDLGCGKCTFLAALAHREQGVNFIGVDISEDILGVARRNIEAEFDGEPVENIALLAFNIEKLDTLFAPQEKAARIYVNFCNPWQKAGDHKRRLTHTRQLETYKRCLRPAASCGSRRTTWTSTSRRSGICARRALRLSARPRISTRRTRRTTSNRSTR